MLHDAESVFHSVCNRYSVENAYLDEKEDTCCAMGELATNCKGSFMPFLNECFKEVRLIKRSKILQMINHSPLSFDAVSWEKLLVKIHGTKILILVYYSSSIASIPGLGDGGLSIAGHQESRDRSYRTILLFISKSYPKRPVRGGTRRWVEKWRAIS